MLAILFARAKEDGQVNGLIPHLVDWGVCILQYADDTIIFMEREIQKAFNMKLILCIFEQLSWLKIKFTRVSYFVSVRQKMRKMSIGYFSVVR
jgi:hypothetical protein